MFSPLLKVLGVSPKTHIWLFASILGEATPVKVEEPSMGSSIAHVYDKRGMAAIKPEDRSTGRRLPALSWDGA